MIRRTTLGYGRIAAEATCAVLAFVSGLRTGSMEDKSTLDPRFRVDGDASFDEVGHYGPDDVRGVRLDGGRMSHEDLKDVCTRCAPIAFDLSTTAPDSGGVADGLLKIIAFHGTVEELNLS